MEIRIYFEGNKSLRPGFKAFFRSLDEAARKVDSRIECISVNEGVSDYAKAVKTHPAAWNILLKDSEEPMPGNPITLCQKLGIKTGLADDVFWMVVMMESWFLADPGALADYYGEGFSSKAIGQTQDVEQIKKSEVVQRLSRATKKTAKREYDKIRHAPYLLERLNPSRVQARALNCRKLFDAVAAKLVTLRLTRTP
ncbi:MAG TPA: DUF4276 family protein [Bryobacteraceae bacterium]|nr:DUF4276 family protein [Bryobacteraceae bacterium]